jgi:uncharacterized repeat protein (TIGR03803 family)
MSQKSQKLNFQVNLRAVAVSLALVSVLTIAVTQVAWAQTFTVIHTFTGGLDGANPRAGLTMDNAGHLYGTNFSGGGPSNDGEVFKLVHSDGGWIFTPLYDFGAPSDGGAPDAVMVSLDGSLYGTTYHFGIGDNGTVFHMTPPATACKMSLCPWSETVLYRFMGGSDGSTPIGGVVFDRAGNLYGATQGGGSDNVGTIYELTPSSDGWMESVLYRFTWGGNDGAIPTGVVFGPDGSLYGTTNSGGFNYWGTIFQLTFSGSGWTEKVLYRFQGGDDGGNPNGGVIFDQSGSLYGTTAAGGRNGGGTVFKFTPSNGSWTLSPIYSLKGNSECGPYASLAMDRAGNLYGTTYCDGAYGYGSVFKLTSSNSRWMYTLLHDFTGGSDGGYSFSNVTLDASGNAYGTTLHGGHSGFCFQSCGVVWEITP